MVFHPEGAPFTRQRPVEEQARRPEVGATIERLANIFHGEEVGLRRFGVFEGRERRGQQVLGVSVAGRPRAAAFRGALAGAPVAENPIVRPKLCPEGRQDEDIPQVDLRSANSWCMLLADIPTVELLEIHPVTAVAPFLFNARLKRLPLRVPGRDKHIVNVSAVEGQSYRPSETTRHPHANMAKAALAMMTRTASTDYAIAARKVVEQRFHPSFDVVDGGARIVAPITTGFTTGVHVWGSS
jgi:hypothetical protein